MRDTKAVEIMTKPVITLDPDVPVKEAADIFIKNDINGAPVVDSEDRLVGIITDSDLVMQDVKLHFPTAIQLLSATILLGSEKKFEERLTKAVGARVSDVMTRDVVTVGGSESLEDVATIMSDKEIGRVPVVEHGKVVGIITKKDIVRTLARGI